MAEWLYEAGIGEARAALVEDGEMVEMAIELDDGTPRPGAILEARLERRADATGRGVVILAGDVQAMLERVPPGLSEGTTLRVELLREAIPEARRLKPPKVRAVEADRPLAPGAALLERIDASGIAVTRLLPHQPDRLEALGWSERIEEAAIGAMTFAWGTLDIAVTPAMTLFDVDGSAAADELAVLGAGAAGRAIRLFEIAGSIGIDLPTPRSKAARLAAAEALDEVLPQPFERTAVNGFGFLQVVRRKQRPSILETLATDPIGAAARALLRRAERATGAGQRTLVSNPRLIARLEREPQWLAALASRTGTAIALRTDPAIAISTGHVETEHP